MKKILLPLILFAIIACLLATHDGVFKYVFNKMEHCPSITQADTITQMVAPKPPPEKEAPTPNPVKFNGSKVGNDSIIDYAVACHYENYTLKIVTKLQHDFLLYEAPRKDRPLVLKQQLAFYKDNKLIKTLSLPFRKKEYQLVGGKKQKSLETVLYSFQVLENEGYAVYSLYGGSFSYEGSVHEFFGLCSLDGNWLSYYNGRNGKYFGDDEPVLKKLNLEHISLDGYIGVTYPYEAGVTE